MRVSRRAVLESRALLPHLLLVPLLLCGCDDSEETYGGTLAGISFYEGIRSEMGMGPDGPIYGYAFLQFTDDTHVFWYHSDLAEFGTYEMESGSEVTIVFGNMFASTYPSNRFVCALEDLQRIAVCDFGTFYTPAVHPDENL